VLAKGFTKWSTEHISQENRALNIVFPRGLQKRFELAIAEGEYARGETLTTADLADRFGVAEDQAELVLLASYRKGLVDQDTQTEDAYRVLGLLKRGMDSVFTHTAKAGFNPRSQVRSVDIGPASPVVAEKLHLEVGSPVYRYVRTRYVDEQAVANQTNFIPYEICPGLEQDDVSRHSFQKLLEGKYQTATPEMQERFSIVPATEEDRNVLGLPEGSKVLLIERTAVSTTAWPVVWANVRVRPDCYQYVAALWPKAAELLRAG
jgi:GntR family transcriptional regulator